MFTEPLAFHGNAADTLLIQLNHWLSMAMLLIHCSFNFLVKKSQTQLQPRSVLEINTYT
jgi:hypothetical protein